MALKKVCCLSLRMGTLVFLYIHLIGCVWGTMSALSDVGDPTINKFISENAPLFYMGLFTSIIGGIIFLTTIISITKKTSANSLLSAAMAFSILEVIYGVYEVVLLLSNGSFEKFYYETVNEEAQNLPDSNVREQYVKAMHALYGSVVAFLCLLLLCNIAFTVYSLLVFHGYSVEMKENMSTNNVPLGKNSSVEAYSSPPPAYTSCCDDQRPSHFVDVELKK